MLWIRGLMIASALVVASCESEDCTQFDPGGGVYRCDQVWLCEVGGGPRWFYESGGGEVYDCQAEDQECTRMLCDSCVLGTDVRALLCE